MSKEIKAASVDTIQFRSLLNECEWQEYVARTDDSYGPTDWSKQDVAEAALIAHINAWSDERCNEAINQLAATPVAGWVSVGDDLPKFDRKTDESEWPLIELAAKFSAPRQFGREFSESGLMAFIDALAPVATPTQQEPK